MRAVKTLSLDVDVINMIDKTAKRQGVKDSQAAEILIRHGYVRLQQLDKEAERLAPDLTDLR